MDKKLGDRANCEVLIPLYQKDYEQNKDDAVWLQRAMNKMGEKDCTDDPMFEKLVEQKNRIEPDAKTAFYLGVLKEKQGKNQYHDSKGMDLTKGRIDLISKVSKKDCAIKGPYQIYNSTKEVAGTEVSIILTL